MLNEFVTCNTCFKVYKLEQYMKEFEGTIVCDDCFDVIWKGQNNVSAS